jgi:hypothetical protein
MGDEPVGVFVSAYAPDSVGAILMGTGVKGAQ